MFREINLSDKKWMDRCRDIAPQVMTVVSFPAVYTWQSTFGLTIDGDSRFYVIRSEADGGYYYPVGETDACRAYVLSLMQSSGFLKLIYVPEQELGWLESIGFDITCDANTSEYVYSSRSLALLDNGSGTNYRVKIRHFSRDCVWSVRPLSFPEDEALLREKATAWDRTITDRSDSEDRLAVLCAVENPAAIDLSGVYIETDTGEWAFLLGYPSTDRIYDLSFVKYSPKISRNAVPVCICEMAKRVCDTWPMINLEDDLGIEGIRKMKTLYHPLCLLDSYTACIR